MLHTNQEGYWGHQFFKVLAEVTVPAMGYTTVVLFEEQKELYPVKAVVGFCNPSADRRQCACESLRDCRTELM